MSKLLSAVAGVAILIGASSSAQAGLVGQININLSSSATGVYDYYNPSGSNPLDYYADNASTNWSALYYDLGVQVPAATLSNLVYHGTNTHVNFATSGQATPATAPFIDDKFFLRALAVNAATTGVNASSNNQFFTNTLQRYSGGLGSWASCQSVGSTSCSMSTDSEHYIDGDGSATINPPGSNNSYNVATRDGVQFDLVGAPINFDFRLVSATFAYVDGSGSTPGSEDDQVNVQWRDVGGTWHQQSYNIYQVCRGTTNADNNDNDRCVVTFDGNLYGTDFILSALDSNDEWKLNSVVWETETGAVPEPATLAMFGFALGGLGLMRRRRGQ